MQRQRETFQKQYVQPAVLISVSNRGYSSHTVSCARVKCSCGTRTTTRQTMARMLPEVRLDPSGRVPTVFPTLIERIPASACEILARRILHAMPSERLNVIMATRFRHREWDGDESAVSSALEIAVDQHW